MDPFITLFKVTLTAYHSVKEIFTLIPVAVNHPYGSFTLLNLTLGVTPKPYTPVDPMHLSQQPGKPLIHQPGI